ncbi:MAG: FecR domain-containing protein [Candidatus Riflebacteria bacterium]|nr:FecR domain-containing protein [Candidatus Riflebacteria bacterium]
MINMKKCPDEFEIQEFLDKTLSASKTSELEKHLEICSSCRKTLEEFSEIEKDISAYCRKPDCPPPQPKFMDALYKEAVSTSRSQKAQCNTAKKVPVDAKQQVNDDTAESALGGYFRSLLLFLQAPQTAVFALLSCFVAALLFFQIGTRRSSDKNGVSHLPEHSVNETVLHFGFRSDTAADAPFAIIENPQNLPADEKKLVAGVKYEVAQASNLKVFWKKSSILDLSKGSQFSMTKEGVVLDNGEVKCVIRPGEAPFSVITPCSSISCLGTEFQVKVSPDHTEVLLMKGKLRINSKTGEKIIQDNKFVKINQSGKIIESDSFNGNSNQTHTQPQTATYLPQLDGKSQETPDN